MLGWLSDLLQKILFLAQETTRNTAGIKTINNELGELSDEVKRLAFEIERLKEVGRYERENLMLQLDNTLLQFERRLPPDSR